ncbi:TDP-4-oxo-6-deoxy-D-glucose transaminase [Citrobacter koseri]|uniref:TDP-4-oxo-6-deoxy-D-glucose transaminase n=1 Tax=Citrobacter koseri TaxID=545 RepID=A0A2X2WJ08_CITKO|nr:TDP-4-oxo-6-deoxy-D-glucose transaminase [Citrobacter koseri]
MKSLCQATPSFLPPTPLCCAGAKIIFVDIRPDTMNIDETLIEAAITDKTRVIVPVHYAGRRLRNGHHYGDCEAS